MTRGYSIGLLIVSLCLSKDGRKSITIASGLRGQNFKAVSPKLWILFEKLKTGIYTHQNISVSIDSIYLINVIKLCKVMHDFAARRE